jgi:MFS family permease
VIAMAVSIWSVMTISCGLAQNFVQLFLSRMGVGIGEAGGSPASQAVVGDLFRREQRATAMSFLSVSSSIGMALGLLWGGLALGKVGWRGAFLLAGVPGLILGPLVLFTLPKAPRGLSDGIRKALPQPPFPATIRLLWSIRSFRYMVTALAFQSFLVLGVSTWIPSFLARSHGLSASTIGKGLAIVFGTANVAGTLIGGRLIDVLGRRDLRWHFWVPTVTIFITGVFAAAFFCAPTQYVFPLLGAQQLFGYMFAGSALAITQSLAPVAVRATASACLWFVIFLVATGIGPQAIGFASDLLRPAFGEESLRIALLGATGFVLPAVFFFYRASLTYRSDLAAADARNRAV